MVRKVKDGKFTVYFCDICGIHTDASVDLGIPELAVSSALEDLRGIELSHIHERDCMNNKK